MAPPNFQELSNFIWSIADLLRGPYRPPQYERVMLPMVVLRRFDCVLEATKPKVLAEYEKRKGSYDGDALDKLLMKHAVDADGKPLGFYNKSPLDFNKLRGDPNSIDGNLISYYKGFSANVRDIFDKFEFDAEVSRLAESNRLYLIVQAFASIDLHPDRVSNQTMGLLFEDLIRRFNEAANETAGDHFTPREVINLMAHLLVEPDMKALKEPGVVVTIYDPTCGTGGMLTEGEHAVKSFNEEANIYVYGQDYNKRAYAVAASDLLMKGQDKGRIVHGDTLINDKLADDPDAKDGFTYQLANPPFGVDWKAQQSKIKEEHGRGERGRFAPGLPRVSDGALLFLLHMLARFEPVKKERPFGNRLAIVFNGSPLFTGGAGSGESEIRRHLIENDWLEAIVALPEQMFYNTGIGTFIWVVSRRKAKERKGSIQLIDARNMWDLLRPSLGKKRRIMNQPHIDAVTLLHGKRADGTTMMFPVEGKQQELMVSKVLPNNYFGYRRITIERPLRLRFQITQPAKEQFLDSVPDFLDAVLAMGDDLGSEPYLDWNKAWHRCQVIAKEHGAKWTVANKKFFRDCFTVIDPMAKPVIKKELNLRLSLATAKEEQLGKDPVYGERASLFGIYVLTGAKKDTGVMYEPDTTLRDLENVPLQEDIVAYFEREVQPYVADAWINSEARDDKDGEIGTVGYEINFNRVFFKYKEPEKLKDIDRELKAVEDRILDLLKGVTT